MYQFRVFVALSFFFFLFLEFSGLFIELTLKRASTNFSFG